MTPEARLEELEKILALMETVELGDLDTRFVAEALVDIVGEDDERVTRWRRITGGEDG